MTSNNDTPRTPEPQQLTASEITIVDGRGRPRIRLGVGEDGLAAVKFYDNENQMRMTLYMRQPDDESEAVLLGDITDMGLLIVDRHAGTIRLGIGCDGFFGRTPHLEIAQGAGFSKRVHLFPPRPPLSED